MLNYSLILVGIVIIIVGIYLLFSTAITLSEKIKRIDELLQDERFHTIDRVSKELDELNFSYYEILSDLSERMDAISEIIEHLNIDKNNQAIIAVEKTQHTLDTEKNRSKEDSQNEQIRQMIDAGFDDNQIAKSLGIGSGKVAIIRQLQQKRNSEYGVSFFGGRIKK